jgi:orotidine-5'-phosphate decarboxylase
MFYDLLQQRWHESGSMICVGLDPDPDRFPAFILEQEHPIFTFCQAIIDNTQSWVCAFKPQIAHFSALGAEDELEMVIDYLKEFYPEIPVILDAKRGDIGSTAEKYAMEAFERYGADALTLNPYLGPDSIEPYLKYDDKGLFVLCHTSNPGAATLQTLKSDGKPLYMHVADMCMDLNKEDQLGLVVGATQIDVLKAVRDRVGDMPILVPGVGEQGGDIKQVIAAGKDAQGFGLVINASRSVLYASPDKDFAKAAQLAVKRLLSLAQ